MSMRTLALTALAASVVLSLSACDPTTPAAPPADPTAAAALAATVPAGGALPVVAATGSTPPVTLVAPAAVQSPAGSTATPKTPAGSSPSARPSAPGTPAATATGPSPSGSPLAGQPATVGQADLKLDSYDKQTGKVVLAAADTAQGAGPSPSASAAASAAATAAVRPGQLIDSPPSAAAPQGALLAITDVKQAAGGKVEASTRPAAVSELLGQAQADIRTALDPHNIQVTPQVKDLKVSYTPKPGGGSGGASAALRLDANDNVPLPGGAKATLAGSIELDPSVDFSYQGGLLSLQQAKVGFDLGAHADWHVTAGLTAATGPVKIPIATLAATPTVMVGALPVVITLNLTVYAEISADGTVTVDAQQSMDGAWGIHADYTKAGGWTGVTDPGHTTVSPVRATFTGNAAVRTGLVADGSVALYDTLGVKATVEPYLRATVNGQVSVDGSGTTPAVDGKAGLSGGLTVNGDVLARIAILGTPLLEKDLPFQIYQHEWPIVTRQTGTGTAGAPTAAATPQG
ncbi:hypothetical protein ACFZB9_15835 [Kitasatospora sp. NPDC008050]|uniref:hypothetical protein n=1 Tax=Kitasatospora sp. NPDC008050 TaxID=3364021 RepID=UPI0036ECE7D1